MKMKQLKTRHALLVSCISLLTSFAMLLSCTYAWFTDTATSGANRIEAGKFRVEAYHQTWQGTKPTPGVVESDKIEGKTDLFKSALNNNGQSGTGNNGTVYKLWEPGAMAVETFTIKNEGELALKYQFNLVAAALNQVTWSGVSGTYDLRDVIKVAIVSEEDEMASMNSRTNFESLSSDKWKSWTDFVSGATKTGNLLPNNSESFIVAMWWPSTPNDNYYNLYARDLGKPSFTYYNCHTNDRLIIDVKTVVTATQNTVEADSFGTDYDANSIWGVDNSASVKIDKNNISGALYIKSETDDNISATIPVATYVGGAVAGSGALKYNTTGSDSEFEAFDTSAGSITTLTLNVKLDSQVETSAVYDISMSGVTVNSESPNTVQTINNIKALNKIVKVNMLIPAGLTGVSVKHGASIDMTRVYNTTDGNDQTFYYDEESGTLILWTSSFSPFTVSWVKTPTAVVNKMEVPSGGVTLYANNNIADQAALDEAYVFNAFEERDYSALEHFINSFISVCNKTQITDISLEDFEDQDKIDAALNQMDNAGEKTRIQTLLAERVPYLNWRADFEVSFDRTIEPGTVALAGHYGAFADAFYDGNWLGFGISDYEGNNPIQIQTGKSIRLLDTMYKQFGGADFHMNYAAICLYVQTFRCGFANLSSSNVGGHITVRLCLYELDNNGDETGERIVCGEYVEELKEVSEVNLTNIANKSN